MQFFTRRYGPDALADARGAGTGNPHDHLARRQFARFGAHRRGVAGKRTDAIDVGFGANVLDRLHTEVERETACRRISRYDQVFRSNTENAVAVRGLKATRVA